MPDSEHVNESQSRRGFFRWVGMFSSLAASYGMFSLFGGRYLLPKKRENRTSKMFVAFSENIKEGDSHYFSSPNGEEYILTRTNSPITPYSAYSSRCPHLGCKVHWQDDEQRFYCPCHGGAFNNKGLATAGPPHKAGQKLKSLDVVVEGSSIYALVDLV